MTKLPTFNPLGFSGIGLVGSARTSALFVRWPSSQYGLMNIRQLDPMSGLPLPEREKPTAQDTTDYREVLRAKGSFPTGGENGWYYCDHGVRELVKGYFARSLRNHFEGAARLDLKHDYLLTNEPDYPSAIGSIEGRGGAYVGVGHMLSYTYPAWQGAVHAYNIDINTRVPMMAVPLYGALLAMASDRFEFLSLIYGKSIPKTEEWAKLIDGPADVLVGFLKDLPRDPCFESTVGNAVRMSMSGDEALYGKSEIADSAMNYIRSFREAIDSDRPSPHSNLHPLWILRAKDRKGRGGTLSSEEQFRHERDIFIDGRITGVASPLSGHGLDMIEDNMRAIGTVPRAVYLSNVEDWFFEDYKKANRDDPDIDPGEVRRNTYDFYRQLKEFNGRNDVRLISALGCYPTTVHSLARYIENAIPLDRAEEDAVASAAKIYNLRYEASRAMRMPLRGRVKDLAEALDGEMHVIVSELRRGWRGRPISRGDAESALLDRSHHFRETLTDWERGAVLRVIEDTGIIARDGDE